MQSVIVLTSPSLPILAMLPVGRSSSWILRSSLSVVSMPTSIMSLGSPTYQIVTTIVYSSAAAGD